MRLTTKGRFAVTAMIDLALRDEGGPVTLAAISERQGISLSRQDRRPVCPAGKIDSRGCLRALR